MTELSDEALMRLYQAGDSDAFDRLFVRHARDLYLALCGLLGQEDPALDLSRQTWQQVHRRRHSFDGQQSFRSWLYAQAAQLRREQARAPSVTASQPGEPQPVTDTASLLRALHGLPASYREALVLHRYVGLSVLDIATALGASEQAVQQRVRQGEQLLLQTVGVVPSKALLTVAPETLDQIARSVLPVVCRSKPSALPVSWVLSGLVLGLGLVLLFVRLHR